MNGDKVAVREEVPQGHRLTDLVAVDRVATAIDRDGRALLLAGGMVLCGLVSLPFLQRLGRWSH